MMAGIFRWKRLVLPPWWAVALILLAYLSIDAFRLYLGWWFDLPGPSTGWWLDAGGDVKLFPQAQWVVLGAAAVAFAVYRAAFHPAHRPGYRAWLACTPWTAAKALPLAPVHLILQDGAILGLLLLLMRTTGRELMLPAFAFLFAYQIAMALTLLITGQRWAAYGLLLCLSIALRLLPAGLAGIAVLVLVYPLTYRAHLRCLAHFPWRTKDPLAADIVRVLAASRPRPSVGSHPLGFPFQYLAPKQAVPAISLAEGTMVSLLAGAWGHAIVVNWPDAESQYGCSVLVCLGPVLAANVVRLILFCGHYWPPISLLGRLATRRYVVWRYDRVLVAPWLALLVLVAGGLQFLPTGAGRTWGMPLVLAVGLWLNLNLGPRLLDWRLTGGHRLGMGIRDRQTFVEA